MATQVTAFSKRDIETGESVRDLRNAAMITVRLLRLIADRIGQPAPSKSPEDYLTPEQVSEEISMSVATVKRLCASGELKSAQIATGHGKGKRFTHRIKRQWLDDYLMAQARREVDQKRPKLRSRRTSIKKEWVK